MIVTVSHGTIDDGFVVVQGDRIVEVGPWHGSKPGTIDLGEVVLMPGLVNAHTHLGLSHLNREPMPGSFVDWLLSLGSRVVAPGEDAAEVNRRAVRMGVIESLRAGVTCVGDIAARSGVAWDVLATLPMRCVAFRECLGLGANVERFRRELREAVLSRHETSRLIAGLSPHAPYTVDIEGYRDCVEIARALAMPIATHLAEHPAEAEFLRDGSGMFAEAYRILGIDITSVPRFEGGPIRFAKTAGLLELPAVLGHVNYADDDELDLLAAGSASVVFCPRTHAYFGHAPHRWREMLARGINMALGTDSRASSPNLSLLEDARLLFNAGSDSEQLLELLTAKGAKALGLHRQVGAIASGMQADLVAFEAASIEDLLERAPQAHRVWIAGAEVNLDSPG
jgi:cytosine/adenosine deaminase-related metal-dependent hydrolase